ncbi:MAG: single-stranded DNA-binding protein [Amylibacter sp.]
MNLGASKSWKDRQSGEWLSKTKWNTVTIFKNTRGFDWLKENLKAGDLVHVRGEMENNSYEKDGVTVYDVTFAADQVSVIPTERDRDAGNGGE